MDENKNKNFEMEILKKRLCFRSDSLCRVEVYLPSIFLIFAVESVKSCVTLFMLLANLCFQVVSVLVKTRLPLHISRTRNFPQIFSNKFSKCLLSFLRIPRSFQKLCPFAAKIWSFYGLSLRFSIVTSKLMTFFQDLYFICPSILLPIFLFIS